MATTILASSLPGIHQNSNLMTGGGTDDTTVLQAALSGSYPGGLILVIDGASLITGLDVSSNTTIQFNSNCGFYLADASDREAIRNVNRSATIITDTNITLTGPGFINGNKAGQSGVSQSDNTPMCAVAFYGISDLTIDGGLEVYDSSAWEIGIGNFSNVVCDSLSLIATTATSNLNTDGLDLRGPGTNATLSNLTILAGDDSISLNSRDYGSGVIGPYIGGGDITDVTIKNIVMQGSLLGIDLISDGSYEISDVSISNLSGTVENYAVYLNLDIFNTPLGNGNFQSIVVSGSTVTQVGSPFGGGIPTGLYIIGGVTSGIEFSQITPLPETINLSAPAATVSGLQIGPGASFDANGPVLVNLQGVSFVQSSAAGNSGTTSVNTTFSNPCTDESWLLVFVLVFPGASVSLSSIGDTINTYDQIATGSTGTSNCYLYQVKKNTSATALDITANFTGTTGIAVIGALEYVGQQQINPVDIVSALLTATSTTYAANPVTTTSTDETVIGLGYFSGATTFAAVSPSVLRAFTPFALGAEDLIAATPGTYTPETTSGSDTFAWFTVGALGQSSEIVSISITPITPSISVGLTQQFTAIGTYADGGTADVTSLVSWSSATQGVATITLGGLAFGVSSGTSSITAALGSVTSSPVILTVTAASAHYSVPDCRDYGNFPNDSVDVNGTLTYTVPSVDSRKAGAPVDSRAAGAPVPSGTYPQNSRTPGVYGPNEP